MTMNRNRPRNDIDDRISEHRDIETSITIFHLFKKLEKRQYVK